MIYMFLSNNPSSGDINLSNLSCYIQISIGENQVLVWFDVLHPSQQLWSCQDGHIT